MASSRTYTLARPIRREDGAQIATVTVHEIVGRHVVQIGDAIRDVQRYFTDVRAAMDKGETPDPAGTAVYAAMLEIIRATTDLGDNVDELRLDDIDGLILMIFSTGE